MIQKSPFKFLDSFTKDDRDIFFGRDREIEELHSRVFESKILLVYGTSGTGKSSLINCGLANKFSDSDWMPVNIRRGTDINRSFFEALSKAAITKTPFEKAGASGRSYNLERLLRSVWLDHFKPVFLIFDQFEELFIFGGKDEKDELIRNVAKVVDSEIQCRFIFAIREEYLAGVTEFEREIPSFLANRIRIEKMTRQNAIQTIEGPCRINNIEVEAGFAEALLEKLNPDTPEVELTWLQIFLDKIMRLAGGGDHTVNRFSLDLLSRAGEVKDILGTFLEEQISQLDDPETGLVVLKSFVSVKGTKHQITEEEVIEYSKTFGKKIDSEAIKELIQKFIRLRILRDKDEEGRYELRHDSLASKIYEKITLVEKELLEVKYFIENAYVNYDRRHLLLSDEDLKYIAPYEDKLFLNEKSLRFIEQSKQALQKARRRRQNIAIAAAAIIILVLSFFTIWAMRERGNAITQQQIAEDQKNAAITARDEAETAKRQSEVLRQVADSNAVVAFAARNQSDKDRLEALSARETALQLRNRAEQMTLVASEQARKAELEKQVADSQRILAQTAESEAKRLSMLQLAQTLALKSNTLSISSPARGLIAVQAFNFNRANRGQPDDPVIYKALESAYSFLKSRNRTLDNSLGGEIRSLSKFRNEIFGADNNGHFVRWYNNDSLNSSILRNNTLPDYVDFVNLNPAGNRMILGWENRRVIIRSIDINTLKAEDIEINGHALSLKAAVWSPDGNYLVTGGNDSIINIWNISEKSVMPIKTLKASSSVISLVYLNQDSIISGHNDGSIILWKVKSAENEKLLQSETEKPLCMVWNKMKNTLLTGCSNGSIILFNLSQKPVLPRRFSGGGEGIDQIVISDDFNLIATASWTKVVSLYNYHQFFELSNSIGGVVRFNLNGRARSLLFTSDNRLLAGLSSRSTMIWETSSAKLAEQICNLIKRDLTVQEWAEIVGTDVVYEKACGKNP